jgi:hypothetical protein
LGSYLGRLLSLSFASPRGMRGLLNGLFDQDMIYNA